MFASADAFTGELDALAATQKALEFESVIANLFEALGYNVTREVRIEGVSIDLIAEQKDKKHAVEVSLSNSRAAITRIRAVAERLSSIGWNDLGFSIPIVVIGVDISHDAKVWTETQYPIHIWDRDFLLAQAAVAPELALKLQALTESSTPQQRSTETDTQGSQLEKFLELSILDNKLSSTQYEDLCLSVFRYLFDPHLYGFEKQKQTTDGGNRYDFICRIQHGDGFWDGIRQDFRTKAILFECKNYTDKIGPDQVYSTERYLFAGALRTVCILVSRLGPTDAAIRAAQGAMRESGKLIILLSNADMIEMLKLKSQNDAPENFIDKRIWDFVVSLSR